MRARTVVDHHHAEHFVPVGIERAEVERAEAADSGEVETLPDGSVSIPVFEEVLVVEKRVVVRERVVIRKHAVIEEQVVEADLRRERGEIEADPPLAAGGRGRFPGRLAVAGPRVASRGYGGRVPTKSLLFTGDPDADSLLATDPLALLIGMLLDQQVPMEKAFHSPYDLKVRLGGRLDAAEIAAMDGEQLAAVFRGPPALHRFPGSMGARTQDMCRALVDGYGGRAEKVWKTAETGDALFANLRSLPGFGEQKARIFTALLAKRLGVTPPGWEEAAGPYARAGYFSVADIDGPAGLAAVRQHKRAMKAAAKAAN